MFTPATRMNLSKNEETALETLARAGTTTQRMARRCRVVLLAAQGTPNRAIARQVGVSRPTVLAVRAAYIRGGCGSSGAGQPPPSLPAQAASRFGAPMRLWMRKPQACRPAVKAFSTSRSWEGKSNKFVFWHEASYSPWLELPSGA